MIYKFYWKQVGEAMGLVSKLGGDVEGGYRRCSFKSHLILEWVLRWKIEKLEIWVKGPWFYRILRNRKENWRNFDVFLSGSIFRNKFWLSLTVKMLKSYELLVSSLIFRIYYPFFCLSNFRKPIPFKLYKITHIFDHLN